MGNHPTIVICGEVFSSNLGDPIIAESLSFLLKTTLSNARIRLLDLEPRRSLSAESPPETPVGRLPYLGWVTRILNKIPISFLSPEKQKKLWWMAFWRRQRYRYYQDRLRGSDLVIIGGGKLLQDNYFDFPLKIFGVSECARKLRIPTIFYACGVGQYWSCEATKIFRRALENAKYICLRDTESARHLRNNLAHLPESKVRIVMDPAVCISEALNLKRQSGKCVGVGVISPDAIIRHAPHLTTCCEEELLSYFVTLARSLVAGGKHVEFFCNGSGEDLRFLNALEKSMGTTHCNIKFAQPAATYRELVSRISQYSHVIACRLHACVTSYSLDIPTLAVAWDPKVASFFVEVGMQSDVVNISLASAKEIVARLEAAVCRLDPAQTEIHKAKAREDLETLLSDCEF